MKISSNTITVIGGIHSAQMLKLIMVTFKTLIY